MKILQVQTSMDFEMCREQLKNLKKMMILAIWASKS